MPPVKGHICTHQTMSHLTEKKQEVLSNAHQDCPTGLPPFVCSTRGCLGTSFLVDCHSAEFHWNHTAGTVNFVGNLQILFPPIQHEIAANGHLLPVVLMGDFLFFVSLYEVLLKFIPNYCIVHECSF